MKWREAKKRKENVGDVGREVIETSQFLSNFCIRRDDVEIPLRLSAKKRRWG